MEVRNSGLVKKRLLCLLVDGVRCEPLTFVFGASLLKADIRGPLIQSDKGVNKIPNLIHPSQISFNYTSQTSMRHSGSGTERRNTSREQREGGRAASRP